MALLAGSFSGLCSLWAAQLAEFGTSCTDRAQSSITVTTLLQHLPARDSTYQSNHKTTSRQRDKQL